LFPRVVCRHNIDPPWVWWRLRLVSLVFNRVWSVWEAVHQIAPVVRSASYTS
jgi:hypothetical protein